VFVVVVEEEGLLVFSCGSATATEDCDMQAMEKGKTPAALLPRRSFIVGRQCWSSRRCNRGREREQNKEYSGGYVCSRGEEVKRETRGSAQNYCRPLLCYILVFDVLVW
jgi:hypothetical protein